MRLRKVVEVMFMPLSNGRFLDVPDDAEIIRLAFRTEGGLQFQEQPHGAWVAFVTERYVEETGTSVHRDELPPPPLQEAP